MAKNQTAQDEFVDLYEVLEVPENADTETIRQRVNALYLEAQQNLDHRNVKKRLQFQQMYEIYLPQARHLLLDARRRGEYDRYLQAYRTGSKVAPTEQASSSASAIGDMAGAPEKISAPDIPQHVEEEVDPEQLAAEREAMWAKWKTGLEFASEEQPLEPLPGAAAPSPSESPSAATSASSAPTAGSPATSRRPAVAGDSAPRQRPQPLVPRFQPPPPGGTRTAAPRPSNAPAQSTARRPAPPPQARPAPETQAPAPAAPEGDRQREQQRYQLIKNAVQNAGLMWGSGAAVAIFLAGCALIFTLDNSLKPNPLGMPRMLFDLLGFILILVASTLGGLAARKHAKRKAVAELSVLPIDELMRRAR
jgi:hypothetical protein